VARQNEQFTNVACKVFSTAYYIAQSDRPYTDHPDLINLQQINGIDVGRVLHTNVTCKIIEHIAALMRKESC